MCVPGTGGRAPLAVLRCSSERASEGTGRPPPHPILSLVMAMTGRKQADDDLAGDGVATLRSRS
jgi:hypothetical protein